jgi:hypothetical protein
LSLAVRSRITERSLQYSSFFQPAEGKRRAFKAFCKHNRKIQDRSSYNNLCVQHKITTTGFLAEIKKAGDEKTVGSRSKKPTTGQAKATFTKITVYEK